MNYKQVAHSRNISKFQIDNESKSYISSYYLATWISEKIAQHVGITIVITDATAGVGGNSISFGKYFKHVNAVEIDEKRAKYLRNNTKLNGANNISVYGYDYVQLMKKLYQDVIFIDPPWGGKNYKSFHNIRCELSHVSIEDICNQLESNTKLIVLKLPYNYDIEYCCRRVKKDNNIVYLESVGNIILVIIKKL